jgi:hypothetical protein
MGAGQILLVLKDFTTDLKPTHDLDDIHLNIHEKLLYSLVIGQQR